MTQEHKEKRKYIRMRKPAIVKFNVKTKKGKWKDPSEWDMGAVLNIGAGGLLFYYTGKVEVDSVLDMQILFHNPEKSINCVGKVIRIEEIPHMWLIAVIFTEIDEKDKDMLIQMAKRFHPEPVND